MFGEDNIVSTFWSTPHCKCLVNKNIELHNAFFIQSTHAVETCLKSTNCHIFIAHDLGNRWFQPVTVPTLQMLAQRTTDFDQACRRTCACVQESGGSMCNLQCFCRSVQNASMWRTLIARRCCDFFCCLVHMLQNVIKSITILHKFRFTSDPGFVPKICV